jgi:hypothetical protein
MPQHIIQKKGRVTMTIVDYFDPYKLEHIQAYVCLHKTGKWPERFLPEDVELSSHWQVGISSKLAKAWVEDQLLANNIYEIL